MDDVLVTCVLVANVFVAQHNENNVNKWFKKDTFALEPFYACSNMFSMVLFH